jgi:hypothetical protein
MKLVCPVIVNGEEQTRVVTTVSGLDANAKFLRTVPGIGKPFWIFNTLPGTVVAADFTEAPLVSEDILANRQEIERQLASPPLDKLTFA